MSCATLEGLGLAAYTVTTPSGALVTISPKEEEEIARRALQEQLHAKLMAPHRLKQVATESAIGAAGNAIGIMVGGLILAWVVKSVMGAPPPVPPMIGRM